MKKKKQQQQQEEEEVEEIKAGAADRTRRGGNGWVGEWVGGWGSEWVGGSNETELNR